MATVQITDDLQQFLEKLSALKNATSPTDPDYRNLKDLYIAASDMLASLQDKTIDDDGIEYREFSVSIKEAMVIFDEAEKKIAKISKVVKIAAKVIDAVGKVIDKVC